jgi:hypothetical protein
MVIGYHQNWFDDYRRYSLGTIGPDLIADGFTTFDPIYRAATAAARNTPKGSRITIGRLKTAFSQSFTIEVESDAAEEGKVLAFTLISPDGTSTSISYTVQPADTTTLIAAAIAALIDAVTDISATSATSTITATADNAGEMFYITGLPIKFLTYTDTTADSSLASEETAIYAEYPKTYGLLLADCPSNARVTALAASIETQERIQGYTTMDTDVGDSTSTTDVMYALKAAQYFRTFGLYSGDQPAYGASTWMGNRFPIDPGSSTWAYKPLSGVTVDDLPAAFQDAVAGKNGNYYVEIAGAAVTIDGKMAAGEWIDIIRGRDWLSARLRERIFGLLINAPKIPFTDKGIGVITSAVEAQLKEGIKNDYLAADPEPIVTAPAAADVSDADKIARTLPDVNFEATLAGAIHIVDPLNGVLKV